MIDRQGSDTRFPSSGLGRCKRCTGLCSSPNPGRGGGGWSDQLNEGVESVHSQLARVESQSAINLRHQAVLAAIPNSKDFLQVYSPSALLIPLPQHLQHDAA